MNIAIPIAIAIAIKLLDENEMYIPMCCVFFSDWIKNFIFDEIYKIIYFMDIICIISQKNSINIYVQLIKTKMYKYYVTYLILCMRLILV